MQRDLARQSRPFFGLQIRPADRRPAGRKDPLGLIDSLTLDPQNPRLLGGGEQKASAVHMNADAAALLGYAQSVSG